jgi:hypothetical protein
MAEEVKIDATEFVKFYKAVSQIDPEIKKALRKHLMETAKPIVEDVRKAALAIPSSRGTGETRKKKGQSLGLRASIAAAVKSDFNGTGRGAVVHVRVSRTRFLAVSGRENVSLPYYMEGRRRRPWRHPVFGNRENWVEQDEHPFLAVTVFKHKEAFMKSMENAVDETLAAIDTAIQKQ